MSKIGKFIIENLTTGMYTESKIIYREYIQNSADQIDIALANNLFQNEDLFIDIDIDATTRIITIKDNATGIPADQVSKKLSDVADSDKKIGEDKGFRGIGRLGGLAYCDTMQFITTAKGESVQTTMIWDAKQLMRLIQDETTKDRAEDMLDQAISYISEPCSEDEHFFIVKLIGVRKENRELLDVDEVREYVSCNTPVPYAGTFLYRSKIYEFMEVERFPLNEYKIYVNDEQAFKNYTTYLYESVSGQQKKKYDEIFDVQFKKIALDNGELLAWMWIGISRFEKAIPESVNEMRGIRLRQSNIQLGDDRTLSKYFKEPRGNLYFVGEVHAVHRGLVPNARRDQFNENSIRNEFEVLLEDYFESLHKLYYGANKAKNAFKKDISLRLKQVEYQQKLKTGFTDPKERPRIEHDIETKQAESVKAQHELTNLRKKTAPTDPMSKVISKIQETYQVELDKMIEPLTGKQETEAGGPITPVPIKTDYVAKGLSKLDRKQQKLVTRIYGVINDVLPENMSQELINKIQDELNK